MWYTGVLYRTQGCGMVHKRAVWVHKSAVWVHKRSILYTGVLYGSPAICMGTQSAVRYIGVLYGGSINLKCVNIKKIHIIKAITIKFSI